jgi:predicted nucleic acid-binding protein
VVGVTLDTNIYVSALEFGGNNAGLTQRIDAIKEDPDDNRILEGAVAAGSSVIVTYDRDLLRLGEYGRIKIIQTVDFVRREIAR